MQIQRAYRKDEQERTMSGSTVGLQRTKDERDLPLTPSKGGTKAT